jgi:hypothetical protein
METIDRLTEQIHGLDPQAEGLEQPQARPVQQTTD